MLLGLLRAPRRARLSRFLYWPPSPLSCVGSAPLGLATRCRRFAAAADGDIAAAPKLQRTYYDTLEVPRKAKKDEIKNAYKRLAKKYHPDRNLDDPTAEARFKEIQEAHATLRDTWKRALYDQDIQFSQFGSAANQSVEREKWTEHWDRETPEMRDARRERYKRYAAGERNDLPPDLINWRLAPWYLVSAFFVAFYVCVQAPDFFDAGAGETFCDPAHDDRTVPLVRAFHDPVMNRWERLPEGVKPPQPAELYAYYKRKRPDLMEVLDLKVMPKVSLTILHVPRTDTVKPQPRPSSGAKGASPALAASS